ncbi:AAA family ATPase [Candidatus Woesearchaeota archaeon]|nr:AAA family ATPase [Candidatus Woesearchaeota archaeon]MBT4783585.1 AAA family ATPase [Candidatus Woesearchaeota archaeon]MBT6941543.1 AAA family ATPase [Candidatus Woesearchaeota archaeon]
MNMVDVKDFLRDYAKNEGLFKNKKALQSNYTPSNVPYRDEQIGQVASILAPSLRMERPSNLFLYGKTGTGKTLVIGHVLENILEVAKEEGLNLKTVYLNCKLKRVADTEYRLIAQIARELGQDIPATGLPTDEVYKLFVKCLEKEKILLLLVLDEIDEVVKNTGDKILYNLTRINSELKESEISIIGISNDLMFIDQVDPRVKSSLGEEEIVFPPYNAIQLQKILRERAELSFESKIIGEGVIEKCAAYAAKEHGDARRALELLRVAGELAERNNSEQILVKYIDNAEEKIERDRVVDIVSTQPKQFKITLFSIIQVSDEYAKKNESGDFYTGDIYEVYKNNCLSTGTKPLTQRRVGDIIAELDMSGIINARVISKGRYGRTRRISLAVPENIVKKIDLMLREGLGL